jgi:trk system potassium uptake protein TrkA
MYVLIVGGGKVGEALAKNLSKRGHDIAVMEKEEDVAKRLAEEVTDILVLASDGCDPLKLEEAKIEKADVVVAVTGDDEDNLIICQLSRDSYKVPKVIARVNNPKNEETFKFLGVDTVSSTQIISKLIEEESSVGDMVTLLSLKKGKISIVEMKIEDGSPALNKQIRELNLPKNSLIITILKGDEVVFPRGDSVIFEGTSVIALTTVGGEKELKKIFLKKGS